MPKIKGKQLLLELEFLEVPRFAMRDIPPELIQFLALQRGRDVPVVGLAIAINGAGYTRIRYFQDGQMRESTVPKHSGGDSEIKSEVRCRIAAAKAEKIG